MKNVFKVWALSLALIASLFLISNKTHANNGIVTLEIQGTSGYCIVGSDVPYGITGFSYSGYSITTGFNTQSGTTTWFCDDANGYVPWTVELASTDVLNMTTNNPVHTIASWNVRVTNDAATKTAWACNIVTWTSQGVKQALDANVVLFGKQSNTGDVCTVESQNVKMTIDLAASQALGAYSGTLTITVPSL